MLFASSRGGLTYADAVRLLGAGDSPVMTVLSGVAGAGAGVASAVTLSSVDFFALRDEMVKWGNKAVRGVREKVTGLSRFDRTQRLVAAHTVIVVSAYFEEFGEVCEALGVDPASLRITAGEQAALVTGAPIAGRADLLRALSEEAVLFPSAAIAPDDFVEELAGHYARLHRSVVGFIGGLAASDTGRTASLAEADLAAGAVRRYESAYRSLAAEVPEFAFWATTREAAAGRATTERVGAELSIGLAGLRELLTSIATGAAAERKVQLATQYGRGLDRPILDATNLPDGIRMPTSKSLYINPRGRVRRADVPAPVGSEHWWAGAVALTDLQPFLAGHFTGPDATTTPLIVLGQPGSGKSLLTRVPAASLPDDQFLPVRVELRTVEADAPIQDQIEDAVYDAIGERLTWPDLVRAGQHALPVVILDGFDELLQASGTNRANYLEQVRDFQRREAELGRPVAVVVTSRVVVVDRARVPLGSTVLRLDPFDDDQIGRWLDVWGTVNEAGLAGRSLTPLDARTALRYRELAEQPLLLLMLALYDAWGNALQNAAGGLDRAGLYERLFTDFARREIAKREPELPPGDERAAVAREIRRLELVAIAMFTRDAQLIMEKALDTDLPVLLRGDRIAPATASSAQRLTAGQLMVGRFFFIHQSQAREGVDQPERSFEFLHATFGEFLVARLIVATLGDLLAEQTYQRSRLQPAPLDAGPLYAWLSFAVLAGRAPIVDFCRAMLMQRPEEERVRCAQLMRDLLDDAGYTHPEWSMAGYEPVRRTVSARNAAFTANLVTLLVLLDTPHANDLVTKQGEWWRTEALLWKSQLPAASWSNLWQSMRMTHDIAYWDVEDWANPEIPEFDLSDSLELEDGRPVVLQLSMRWLGGDHEGLPRPFRDLTVPADSPVGLWLREAAFTGTDVFTKDIAYSMAPFWSYVGPDITEISDGKNPGTNVALLWEILLAPRDLLDRGEQRRLTAAYLTSMEHFATNRSAKRLISAMLEEDARSGPTEVILSVFRTPSASPFGHHARNKRWSINPISAAQIMATVYARLADKTEFWEVFGDSPDSLLQDETFRAALRHEFERLGAEFPQEAR